MKSRRLWFLPAALAAIGCWQGCSGDRDGLPDLAEARRAYQRGDHKEAFVAHLEALDSMGTRADRNLLFDCALIAVEAGSPRDAEVAAARAAARQPEDPETLARAAFLRGHGAWQRCLILAAQASGPEAGPADLLLAIRAADAARQAWIAAACHGDAWPEATRNAERAVLKLEELRAQEAAMAQGKTRKEPGGQEPGSEDSPPQQAPKLVQQLLEQLAARERAKQDLRRRTRDENGKPVEKDW